MRGIKQIINKNGVVELSITDIREKTKWKKRIMFLRKINTKEAKEEIIILETYIWMTGGNYSIIN